MDVSIVSPKTPFYRPVFSAIGEKQEEDLLAGSQETLLACPPALWEQENAAFQAPYQGEHLTNNYVNQN